MSRVTRSADCGNSPRNQAAESLVIGLEGGEWHGAVIGDRTVWKLEDGGQAVGADAIRSSVPPAPQSIRIDQVATHGKAGAVSGVTDGQSFVHVLSFTSASAKQLATIDSFRKTEK